MKKLSHRLFPFLLLVALLYSGNILASDSANNNLTPQTCAENCATKRDKAIERCGTMSGANKTRCESMANSQYDKCMEGCSGKGTP